MNLFDMVTQNNFTEYVKSNENVIAYFWATWCGACKAQDPVLEQIATVFPNQIKVARIDTEKNPSLAIAYQILGTPTLMLFKKGNKVRFKSKKGGKIDRFVGAQDFRHLKGVVNYLINMKIMKREDK